MIQISKFFRELTEDNSYCKVMFNDQMKNFIAQFKENINEENCEFVINMTIVLFNLLEASDIAAIHHKDSMTFFIGIISKILAISFDPCLKGALTVFES